MYKGYKNILYYKNSENNTLQSNNKLTKCSKCNKFNSITISPAQNNIIYCVYCGNSIQIYK